MADPQTSCTRLDSSNSTLAERMVFRAVPTMPEMTTARRLADQLPHLSRSTIDKALRRLRREHVMSFEGSQARWYARYIEGSLL